MKTILMLTGDILVMLARMVFLSVYFSLEGFLRAFGPVGAGRQPGSGPKLRPVKDKRAPGKRAAAVPCAVVPGFQKPLSQ